tara:strand:- start:4422 stop:4565 length:144 start_codon:yes stop_codon:yes gene_type:complete
MGIAFDGTPLPEQKAAFSGCTERLTLPHVGDGGSTHGGVHRFTRTKH